MGVPKLVAGATLACTFGGQVSVKLQLPTDHSIALPGGMQINEKDAEAKINIPPFEKCEITGKPCIDSMEIIENKWQNANHYDLLDFAHSVDLNGFCLCVMHGIIFPVDSGQGVVNPYLTTDGSFESTGLYNYMLGKYGAAITKDSFFGACQMVAAGMERQFSINPYHFAVKLQAELIKLQGKVAFGDSKFGIEGTAQGALMHASAGADLDVRLTKDLRNTYVSGGAVAALLKGDAELNITICGIKIGVSAGGFLGGAGAEGTAGMVNGTFVVKGTAGIGLGGSVGISIGPAISGISPKEEGKNTYDKKFEYKAR